MQISETVAAKIQGEQELLDYLRSADPNADTSRGVLLQLKIPPFPKDPSQGFERETFLQKVRDVGDEAERALAAIEGLRVHKVMKNIASASVGGTALALAKAIELDCVEGALIGDRPILRGALRQPDHTARIPEANDTHAEDATDRRSQRGPRQPGN